MLSSFFFYIHSHLTPLLLSSTFLSLLCNNVLFRYQFYNILKVVHDHVSPPLPSLFLLFSFFMLYFAISSIIFKVGHGMFCSIFLSILFSSFPSFLSSPFPSPPLLFPFCYKNIRTNNESVYDNVGVGLVCGVE